MDLKKNYYLFGGYISCNMVCWRKVKRREKVRSRVSWKREKVAKFETQEVIAKGATIVGCGGNDLMGAFVIFRKKREKKVFHKPE